MTSSITSEATRASVTPNAAATRFELPDTARPPHDIMLQVLLSKLEASRTFDWHELSIRLSAGAKESPVKVQEKKAKNTGGKGSGKVKMPSDATAQWTGTELYELYHYQILPALRAGRLVWLDNHDLPSPSSFSPPSPSTGPPATPRNDTGHTHFAHPHSEQADEGKAREPDDDDDGTDMPLLEMPELKRQKPSRPRGKAMIAL